MLIRALIVLLIALNLGAAAWWISRPAVQPAALPEQPAGVARLQLLGERGVMAKARVVPPVPVPAVVPTPAEAAPIEAAPPPVVAAAAMQCFSIGPFDNDAAATAATARIAAQTTRVRPREVPGQQASG